MHALVRGGEIREIRALPKVWFDIDEGRWWDLTDRANIEAAGWLSVVRTDRPQPAGGTVHDWSVELVDGVPVEMWTERPKTPREVEADARMGGFEDRLALVEAAVFGTPPDPDTPDGPDVHDWAHYAGAVPPQALLLDGGKVWRNVAGVPLTTAPSGFVGWTIADLAHLWKLVLDTDGGGEDPGDYPQYRGEWDPDTTYIPGDHVTRNSTVYRCLIGHGPEYQGTWGPPAAGVWVTATP